MQKINTSQMRAVIYARYSSHNQTEQSIEGQLHDCHAFARKHNYTVLTEYIDRAKSAKTDHRPEFQRMIKDSERRLFDVIIVWKLDRFARNRYDSANYKAKLKKHGVRVLSAMENITANAEGILMESLLEGMAEYYSAELAEKVKRGMRETALKCHVYGSIPYGYRSENKKFAIDEDKAKVVRYIFSTYADGQTSIRNLLKYLHDNGIKNQKGNDFSKNSIQVMLSNPRYKGIYKYADIEIPGGMPRIIDDETFAECQRRLKYNKEKGSRFKARTVYILSGKLYCGLCKSVMVGDSVTSRNGSLYFYYTCSKRKTKSKDCRLKSVAKDYIENVVVDNILNTVLKDDIIERIAENAARIQEEQVNTGLIDCLKSSLKETETAIQNIMRAIEQGVITPTTTSRLRELESQAENIKYEIENEKLNNKTLSKEEILYLLNRLRKGDPNDTSYRQKLIDTFIYRIYVFEDKLLILYNYSNNENKEQEKSLLEYVSSSGCIGSPIRPVTKTIFFYGKILAQIYIRIHN